MLNVDYVVPSLTRIVKRLEGVGVVLDIRLLLYIILIDDVYCT